MDEQTRGTWGSAQFGIPRGLLLGLRRVSINGAMGGTPQAQQRGPVQQRPHCACYLRRSRGRASAGPEKGSEGGRGENVAVRCGTWRQTLPAEPRG